MTLSKAGVHSVLHALPVPACLPGHITPWTASKLARCTLDTVADVTRMPLSAVVHESKLAPIASDRENCLQPRTDRHTTPAHTLTGSALVRRAVVWDARAHRRGRLPAHRSYVPPSGEPADALAPSEQPAPQNVCPWVLRYIHVAVGPCFGLGAALFIVSNAAQLFSGHLEGTWSVQQEDARVNIPLMVRICFCCTAMHRAALGTAACNADASLCSVAWLPRSAPRRCHWRGDAPRLQARRVANGPSSNHNTCKMFSTSAPVQVGAVAFAIAAWLAWVEASNVHHCADVAAWLRGGQKGPRPRLALPLFRAAHVAHEWLGWHGSCIRFLGTLFFIVGVATKFVQAHRGLRSGVVTWLHTVPFFLGSVSVTAGAYLIATEARHSWARALTPPRTVGRRAIGKWVAFVNLVGSLLFLAGGIVGFVANGMRLQERRAADGLTWVLGSCVFVVKAVLLCVEGFTLL
jgi:hypothetical protein